MRIKAYSMGANFVKIIANPIDSDYGATPDQTTAVAIGNAYYCKDLPVKE